MAGIIRLIAGYLLDGHERYAVYLRGICIPEHRQP
jgi:hypothetical protein